MGWDVGWNNKRELIEYIDRNNTVEWELIDKSLVGGVYYRVLRNKETGFRFIAVTLVKGFRYEGQIEWGKKDMDESMGPCETTCPERLLAQSDDTSEYAVKWRTACRANRAAKKVDRKFLAGLKRGDTFLWSDQPITFLYTYTGKRGGTRYVGRAPSGNTYRYPANQIRKPASADTLPPIPA